MWLRPRSDLPDSARRYEPGELAALLEPLGLVIDSIQHAPVRDIVTERILQRMEPAELVYALHETFRTLLEETPPPERGHPGYQQAIIAELLTQTQGLIEGEMLDPVVQREDHARRSAWRSFAALCGERDERGHLVYPLIEELELVYEDPEVHLCPQLTQTVWEHILLDESSGVVSEFLADDDWRMDWILDQPPDETRWIVREAGIDLDTVHRLPHTPNADEAAAAESYLRDLVALHERGT